jgi:hypothetical protein
MIAAEQIGVTPEDASASEQAKSDHESFLVGGGFSAEKCQRSGARHKASFYINESAPRSRCRGAFSACRAGSGI